MSTLDSCPQEIEVTLGEALYTCCEEYGMVKKLWGSLSKTLLTCCDQYYRGKKLCGVTNEATLEEDNPVVR
jgi:hypothetical protein